MAEYPMRTSNKRSESGMAHARKGAGDKSIEKEEGLHAGSCNSDGIRFKVHGHPDFSDLHSPENSGRK